ncbi:MAG: L-aspartate oxidase [Silvanigrellales bacterium]|nr:L-aspartate oxidase [Silvanigrellales bacterium]
MKPVDARSPLWKKKQVSSPLKVDGDLFFDFLVIGSGIAGASLALKLATLGRVAIVCKETLLETNTRYAQGGIASVFLENDSYDEHTRDTLVAGAGLCHEDVVRKVVSEGPGCIRELIGLGVEFTPSTKPDEPFEYHLTREGGHSARRIIHSADVTGFAVQAVLADKVRTHPNITVFEHHTCVDLIITDKACPDFSRNRTLGAYVLSDKDARIFSLLARGTFLATGGHGKLYLYTTNPDSATGDGVAMAARAGARVANLEFMQFHPTCLYSPQAKNFLISEALRGEGAILLSRGGERFMERVDPRLELAPRDIVARAIDAEIKRTGEPFVLLDISHKPADFIRSHFPNIYQRCLELGLDITKEPLPVVPAAHYSCGGVVTDSRGRTGIKALWALGEVACTGLHGANRLASNSLLEGLAFASFVFEDVKILWDDLGKTQFPEVPRWEIGKAGEADEMSVVSQLWDEIRRTMWNYVGIVRSEKRLARAEARIRQIVEEIDAYYWDVVPSRALIEVRNLATVAHLTVKCARARKESRGIHFSLDYPHADDARFQKDTVLT